MKIPLLPEMPVPIEPWLQIGDYYIARWSNGDFWVEHESGEGMQVKRRQMEKLISDFYRENF